MACALQLESSYGSRDLELDTHYTLATNDSLKAKFRYHSGVSGYQFIFSGYIPENAGRWLVAINSNQWFLRLGSSGFFSLGAVSDGEIYEVELKKTGTLYELIVDGTTIKSHTTLFTPLPVDFLGSYGAYGAEIDLIYFSATGLYVSADASDRSNTGAQPVLVDTIGNNDATGVNFPTDGSAWVDLGGGGISVTDTSNDSNSTSLFDSVLLVAPLNINDDANNTSSLSNSDSISFSSSISINDGLNNSYSVSNLDSVSFVGQFIIADNNNNTESLSTTDVIVFSGAVIISDTLSNAESVSLFDSIQIGQFTFNVKKETNINSAYLSKNINSVYYSTNING